MFLNQIVTLNSWTCCVIVRYVRSFLSKVASTLKNYYPFIHLDPEYVWGKCLKHLGANRRRLLMKYKPFLAQQQMFGYLP